MATETKPLAANQTVAYVIDEEARTITFTVPTKGTRTFDTKKASEINNLRAMLKGYAQQRMVDSTAVTVTGKTRDEVLELKWTKLNAVIDHVESGTDVWEMPRTGGGGPRPVALDIILEAIRREFKLESLDIVNARLAVMVKKHGGDLEAHARKMATSARVAVKVAEIQAEKRAAANPDASAVDALVDGFMNDEEDAEESSQS